MRGVSEVIAIILILMITIAIAGIAYTFMSSTMSSVTTSASSSVDATTSSMLTSFIIESVNDNHVYIRNTGQNALSSLTVYVDDIVVNYSAPALISPGEVGTIIVTGIIFEGDTIKITSSNGISASRKASDEWYGAVAYWKFDEGSGTIAHDSSPTGNDGTMANGPVWIAGKHGTALNFDGADDYIFSPYSSMPVGDNAITYSAWFKMPSAQSTYDMLVGWVYNDPTGITFDSSNRPCFALYNTTGNFNWYCPTAAPPLNMWTFIATTYSSGTAKIYVNGELNASYASFLPRGKVYDNLYIGYQAMTRYFNGTIDEVAIWNRSLNAQEISKLYNK